MKITHEIEISDQQSADLMSWKSMCLQLYPETRKQDFVWYLYRDEDDHDHTEIHHCISGSRFLLTP